MFITANYGLRRDVSEEEKNNRKSITDLLLSEYGDNQDSDKEFLALFDKKYFDYTKPIALLYNLITSSIIHQIQSAKFYKVNYLKHLKYGLFVVIL